MENATALLVFAAVAVGCTLMGFFGPDDAAAERAPDAIDNASDFCDTGP